METSEITVECFDDFKTIQKKLKSSNWKFKEKFILNGWYYSNKSVDELKDLQYAELISNSFLVRQIIEDKNEENLLCYKSKKIDKSGVVLSESKIDNLKNTLKIFDFAKLNMWCNVENTTYVYSKNDMEIAVQIIKNLGIFLEFEEFESIKDYSSTKKIKNLIDIIKNQKLNIGKDFSCKKVLMLFKENFNQK